MQSDLRAAVHAVEEKLAEANLDALTVKMLMMRRHEKDFMLRGDEKYIANIDQRRQASLGAAWGPMKLTTSVVPFAAVLAGRSAIDWRGIGWWRPLLGPPVYAALLHLHRSLSGVSPLPC